MSTLVPHTGVARLITRVLASAPGVVDAIGAIPADHPLVTDGRAPTFLAIELGAQAAAAMETLGRQAAPEAGRHARSGALVRVKDARFECASLPVELPIHVTARLEGAASPLAIYRIVASLDGVAVLEAVISTHAGPVGSS